VGCREHRTACSDTFQMQGIAFVTEKLSTFDVDWFIFASFSSFPLTFWHLSFTFKF
jgi:hypothetical protein